MADSIVILAGTYHLAKECAEAAGLTRSQWTYMQDVTTLFGTRGKTVWRCQSWDFRKDRIEIDQILKHTKAVVIDK